MTFILLRKRFEEAESARNGLDSPGFPKAVFAEGRPFGDGHGPPRDAAASPS
jgi:hypothetical protein